MYRIRDWDKNYETSETRKLKRLQWVALPNRHDGKGYKRLLRSQDGPLLFAAWVLIVQVASKSPIRGLLADQDGPLTFEDLTDKTGFPAELFEKAIKRLLLKDIAWLEEIESPATPADAPAVPASSAAEGRKEGKKESREGRESPPDSGKASEPEKPTSANLPAGVSPSALVIPFQTFEADFEKNFWSVYPKKYGRDCALRIWVQLNPDADLQLKIFNAVSAFAKRADPRENYRWCLNPENWLIHRHWTDEIPSVKPTKKSASHVEFPPETPQPFEIEGKPITAMLIGEDAFRVMTGDKGEIIGFDEAARSVKLYLLESKTTVDCDPSALTFDESQTIREIMKRDETKATA